MRPRVLPVSRRCVPGRMSSKRECACHARDWPSVQIQPRRLAMKITFQSALITGSSSGIGRAIAIKLAQEGVKKIGIHYYSRKDEAEKTLAEVREAGSDGVLVQGDTSDAEC